MSAIFNATLEKYYARINLKSKLCSRSYYGHHNNVKLRMPKINGTYFDITDNTQVVLRYDWIPTIELLIHVANNQTFSFKTK